MSRLLSEKSDIAIRLNSFVATWAIHELHKRDPEKAREIIDTASRKYFGCSHEYEWVGGGSTPDGPIEPEHVCKHCGSVNMED